MRKISGLIYTKDGIFQTGTLSVEEDKIVDITFEKLDQTDLNYIIPGLVDIHFHGCAGYDFCDGTKEALTAIEKYELEHGITSICPATMTLSADRLAKICTAAAEAGLSNLRGINLEGPFISLAKKGAQNPAYIQKPNTELLERLNECSKGLVKLVAIAPEEEGAMECIKEYSDKVQFSIAHTCADYDTASEAIKAGASHVTHLYNAMPPFTHRAPGVVGAAFDHKNTDVELICDGVHIHPSMVRATFSMFGADRVILISDSMMATGMEDGMYELGGQDVTVKGNLATLKDGTIAGSATNLYDCMVHAIGMGIPVEDAVKAATKNPARSIGIDKEYGSLEAGKKADILIMNKQYDLLEIIKAGKTVI